MSTYSNAHANTEKWIFYVQFPGNRSEFSIITYDFLSSTIWVIPVTHSDPRNFWKTHVLYDINGTVFIIEFGKPHAVDNRLYLKIINQVQIKNALKISLRLGFDSDVLLSISTPTYDDDDYVLDESEITISWKIKRTSNWSPNIHQRTFLDRQDPPICSNIH